MSPGRKKTEKVGAAPEDGLLGVLGALAEFRDECANPVPDYTLRRAYRNRLFARFDALRDRLHPEPKKGENRGE